MTAVVAIGLNSPYPFWQFDRHHAAKLRTEFPEVEFLPVEDDEIPRSLAHADVYFGWRTDPSWLPDAPRLRWIASPAAGVDHLPAGAIATAGITLTRGFGYHARPMTEHALGLLLGFSRGLFTSWHLQTRAGWWKDAIAETFFDLHAETLAVVGCGHVGVRLAEAAGGLGMRVIGVRRRPPSNPSHGIAWRRPNELHEVLAESRAVINLLPATEDTHHFFNGAAFAAFRPGSVFINLGRASTVDHTALLAALDEGPLLAAALDVMPRKPPPDDDPLRHHPRLVLTPKSAVFSHSYMDGAVSFFAENLRRYLAGHLLTGAVPQFPVPAHHEESYVH